MTFQAIAAGNGADIRCNDNFDAVAQAGVFGKKNPTTSGLTFGYFGGNYNGNAVADGTVALTASSTNYIVALISTGVVSVSTTNTNWLNTNSYIQLFQVVTGTASITSWSDFRQTLFPGATIKTAINEAPEVTLASAATVNIGAASANSIIVTGTTTITAFDTIADGARRLVTFSGALTLTNNATSLILPGGANITTAAGDVAQFLSLGGGNWRCIDYQTANGSPIAVASATVLGGVKVGAGLSIASGVLAATGSSPGTQSLTDFANAAGTTTGLTYGYQAGVIRADNVTTAVVAGTVALTNNTTNYVEITGAGVVSANATGFTSGRFPLCTVVTSGGAIGTITDKRGVIALGGVQLSGVNVFTKNQSVGMVALTDAATVALDASLSNSFELLATSGIGATRKIGNATNATAGMVLNIWFYQDSSGSRALTWDTNYKVAGGTGVPAASTAVNAVDFYSLSYSATKGIWVVTQQKGVA